MNMFQVAGLFLLFIAIVAVCSPVCAVLNHFSDLVQEKTEEQKTKNQLAKSLAKLEEARSKAKPLPVGRLAKNKPMVFTPILEPVLVPEPKRVPKQIAPAPINTSSNIKEYRLPDGSKVAFDITKVEFSEKSAII